MGPTTYSYFAKKPGFDGRISVIVRRIASDTKVDWQVYRRDGTWESASWAIEATGMGGSADYSMVSAADLADTIEEWKESYDRRQAKAAAEAEAAAREEEERLEMSKIDSRLSAPVVAQLDQAGAALRQIAQLTTSVYGVLIDPDLDTPIPERFAARVAEGLVVAAMQLSSDVNGRSDR